MTRPSPVHVIGAGLAGSEAAHQIASAGVPVVLHEMRPIRGTEAHKTDGFAELVCSNSFRSDDWENNAVGLLHEEMRRAGSLIIAAGDAHKLPAGGALAVDRDAFSAEVTARLSANPLVTIERGELDGLPPDGLEQRHRRDRSADVAGIKRRTCGLTGEDSLAFFDAIAPVVHRDSIDTSIAWFQSRYDKSGPAGTGADYLNCPMSRPEYEAFVDALLAGDKTSFKEWEASTPYFDGCLPIEVMAERGRETLRFGPMKPVGLDDPRTGRWPYAVVQLRQDNALGTLWNMVGFQTKLKHAEQVRIFRMIPGLENAEFARLGGLHRNTYINSPKLLDASLRLKVDAAPALCRSDHRRRRLCRKRRDRPAGRSFRCRPMLWSRRPQRRQQRRHSARFSITSPAGISSPTTASERARALIPADEHQLRIDSRSRHCTEARQARSAAQRTRTRQRKKAHHVAPRTCRSRNLARRRRRARHKAVGLANLRF